MEVLHCENQQCIFTETTAKERLFVQARKNKMLSIKITQGDIFCTLLLNIALNIFEKQTFDFKLLFFYFYQNDNLFHDQLQHI